MKRSELAYMASALAMMSQGLEPPLALSANKQETKRDKKKCKSCKFFQKNNHRTNCTNPRGKSYAYPMDCACEHYAKRKK